MFSDFNTLWVINSNIQFSSSNGKPIVEDIKSALKCLGLDLDLGEEVAEKLIPLLFFCSRTKYRG